MRYYLIRHKASGEFMPELRRTRGYSHWNPAKVDTVQNLGSKVIGTPRLFPTRKMAHNSINQWNANPNAYNGPKGNGFGYDDYGFNINPDGRSKDDLEIVEVDIVEVIV